MSSRLWGALVATALVAALPAHAAGRLDKIRESGTITLGHPETSVPFAFLDGDQKPIGYTVEICEHVARAVQKVLDLPTLTVRHNPTTSATRLPLLANGTIDLECGNTTNKVERHRLVSFAPTTFVAQVVLVSRKDADVNVDDLASYKGKTIAAQAGGQTFKLISQLNAKHKLNITVAPAKNTAEAFLMMTSGRAAASVHDDGLAYGAVASSRAPDEYTVGSKGFEVAPYGIVEPKGDPAFKKVVDDAVIALINDGTIEKLYAKYFTMPIPPKQINLRFPMSDALKRALAKPTDSGNPADYE